MNFLDNQKNYAIPNTLYSENQRLRWTGSYTQAIELLRIIPHFKSSESLFEFFDIDEFPLAIIKNWNLEEISKSALFFYLENLFSDKKRIQANLMSAYAWQVISGLIINSEISTSILDFIKELDLVKISQNKIIISGSCQSIERIYNFEKRIFNEIGLQNLLSFLKIDLDSRNFLIEQAFEKKNLKNIAAFLFSYEARLDKTFVLTQTLRNYKDQNFDKNLKKTDSEIEKVLTDILQVQMAELETFDIFDLFESDEAAKSKKDFIFFYSFYQELFEDLISKEKTNTRPIFELFEEFLLNSEQKIILLKNISFTDLSKIINKFFFAKKNQINKIFEKNQQFFSYYLLQTGLGAILLGIIVVGITIVKAPGVVRRINESRPASPPFAMMSYNCYYSRKQIVPKLPQITETSTSFIQPSQTSSVLQVNKSLSTPRPVQTRSTSLVTAKAQQPVALTQVKQNCSKVEQVLQRTFNNTPTTVQVNVGYEFDKPTGLWVSTNKANILNTVGTYADNEKVKTAFVKIAGENGLQVQKVPQDREHVTVGPILRSYGIPREGGATFLMLRPHHVVHTNVMDVSLPLQFGYDPQKGNAIDWHEHLADVYDSNLVELYDSNPTSKYLLKDNTKAVETLAVYGIDMDDVRNAARTVHNIDINRLNELDIPHQLLLPTSHINMLCQKGKQDFDLFTQKSSPGCSINYSANKASQFLEVGLEEAININRFYHSLEPYFVQGTTERATIQSSHRQFKNAVNESIAFTIDRGGSINQNLVQEFETRFPSGRLYDLDQAENVARTEFALENVKRGIPSCLWSTNSPTNFD